MAITNMKELFDKLQEYIDQKIDGVEGGLKDLFEEYQVKEIIPYLSDIRLVAQSIDDIIIVADNATEIKNVSDNLQPILDAPQYVDEINDGVQEAEQWFNETEAAKDWAYKWSSEVPNTPVDDGTNTGYSAFHWSEVAQNTVYQITLKGGWNPEDGTYPTPDAHGDYWIVTKTANYDDITWYAGDMLVWKDDATGQEWLHKQEAVHWLQIVGKPSAYTPKPHYHSEYVQIDNLLPYSNGPDAAGYPIKLDINGQISNTMIKLPVVTIIGTFTPVPTSEYPEYVNMDYGYSWLISGVHPTDGYTFLTGELAGRKIRNGDILINAVEGWIIQYDKLDVNFYLRRDGQYPMFGNLNMGNNRIEYLSDGIADTDAATIGQLGTELDNVFTKDEFLSTSGGTADQGKPVILNEWGLIDETMVNFNALIFVGLWNPEAGQEYPDVTGMEPGHYWRVDGTGDDGYEFTTGDLAGETLYDGDYMVLGQAGWVKLVIKIEPEDYYRLDGTNPLTADFNGGGYRLSRVGRALTEDDAIIMDQLDEGLATKADVYHTHSPIEISPQGAGSTLDADFLDGYDSTDFAMHDHTHQPGDIQPQGADSGLDADMLDGKHGTDFRAKADPVDWSDLDNVPTEFNPVKANQTTIGGMRVWADGDILNFATDDYVAP